MMWGRDMTHTIATNGYWSMISRMFRISASRFGPHTSRMRDMVGSRQTLGRDTRAGRRGHRSSCTGPATQPTEPRQQCLSYVSTSNMLQFRITTRVSQDIKKKRPRSSGLKPRHVCVTVVLHVRRQCTKIEIERVVSHSLGSNSCGGRVRERMPHRD